MNCAPPAHPCVEGHSHLNLPYVLVYLGSVCTALLCGYQQNESPWLQQDVVILRFKVENSSQSTGVGDLYLRYEPTYLGFCPTLGTHSVRIMESSMPWRPCPLRCRQPESQSLLQGTGGPVKVRRGLWTLEARDCKA